MPTHLLISRNARNLAAIVVSATALSIEPASAGKLLCEPVVVSELAEAPTELEAKRHAMNSWFAITGRLGPDYLRWQNAFNRELACARTSANTYRCQAAAKPCKAVYNIGGAKLIRREPVPSALDPSISSPGRPKSEPQ